MLSSRNVLAFEIMTEYAFRAISYLNLKGKDNNLAIKTSNTMYVEQIVISHNRKREEKPYILHRLP